MRALLRLIIKLCSLFVVSRLASVYWYALAPYELVASLGSTIALLRAIVAVVVLVFVGCIFRTATMSLSLRQEFESFAILVGGFVLMLCRVPLRVSGRRIRNSFLMAAIHACV